MSSQKINWNIESWTKTWNSTTSLKVHTSRVTVFLETTNWCVWLKLSVFYGTVIYINRFWGSFLFPIILLSLNSCQDILEVPFHLQVVLSIAPGNPVRRKNIHKHFLVQVVQSKHPANLVVKGLLLRAKTTTLGILVTHKGTNCIFTLEIGHIFFQIKLIRVKFFYCHIFYVSCFDKFIDDFLSNFPWAIYPAHEGEDIAGDIGDNVPILEKLLPSFEVCFSYFLQ